MGFRFDPESSVKTSFQEPESVLVLYHIFPYLLGKGGGIGIE